MKAYTKYSNFMENTIGLGRNGKRLAHGGAVGGGVFAAGHYGGVQVIQDNTLAAVGAGVVTGFLGTLALDLMLLDTEQEALLLKAQIEGSDKETQARLLAHFFGEGEPAPAASETPAKPSVRREAKA
jgi:hypothetical protein